MPVIIFDDFTTATKFADFPFKVKSSAMKILKPNNIKVNIRYVCYAMQHIRFDSSSHKRYWISEYSDIKIPLPPLEVQEEIVKELDGYQAVIDGAQKVIDNWRPIIPNNPEWKMVRLGDVCEIVSGQSPEGAYYNENGEGCPFYQGKTEFTNKYIGKPKNGRQKLLRRQSVVIF